MEHGSGYKFLEKIIQARLALPSHGQAEMASLVTSAMDGQKGSATETASGTAAGKEPRPEGRSIYDPQVQRLLMAQILGRRRLEEQNR